MSTFDPSTVRKAVDEFTPGRPERFRDLAPAKEVIVELRQKRASYQAIADILTQHCLAVSKTSVAAYCHQVLGEVVRPRRRANRKRTSPGNREGQPARTPERDPFAPPEEAAIAAATNSPRPRGPRIAQVRIARNS